MPTQKEQRRYLPATVATLTTNGDIHHVLLFLETRPRSRRVSRRPSCAFDTTTLIVHATASVREEEAQNVVMYRTV